jgi:hypothetical protein
MSGRPVVEAAVLIDDSSPTNQDHITLTDEQGEYCIDNLSPGAYKVIVNAPGRIAVSRCVDVDGMNQSVLDFLLGY